MRKINASQENWLEVLRAAAILLVVFGHSIILYSSVWSLYSTTRQAPILDILKKIIDLIQMPLFFSISGFCFHFTLRRSPSFGQMLKKKLLRLLVPFAAAAFLWMLPIRLLLRYPGWQGHSLCRILLQDILWGNDCGHLWYLPTLFFCFVLAYPLCRLTTWLENGSQSRRFVLQGLLFCLLLAASCLINQLPAVPYLRWTVQYFVWFYGGFCLYEHQLFLRRLPAAAKIIWVCLSAVATAGAVLRPGIFLTAIASLCLVLCGYLCVPGSRNPVLRLISQNSFGIYLLHSPLIYITFTWCSEMSPVVVVLLNFLGFGSIALALTVLLRKTPLKFLIGN